MSKSSANVTVTLITALNLAVVAGSSLFAIYGDGTHGAMYQVLGIGGTQVAAFAVRAFIQISRGEEKEGILLSAKALPYAMLLVVLYPFVPFLTDGMRGLAHRIG